jgi:soluble lytic murein transglycosylase-like protein
MQSTANSMLGTGFAAVGRMWSLARTLFALIGLLGVVVAANPASREWIVRQAVAISQLAVEEPGPTLAAGEIQAEDRASQRERRAVAEFIAKRYRVAEHAVAGYVAAAYRAGVEHKVDPLLILAVAAIESRYNPVAESVMGAKGLMQVIPKFHQEKLVAHGGDSALLDPVVNIQVGARILREYQGRFGGMEGALQAYNGAFEDASAPYARAVLAERSRLEQTLVKIRRTPT